MSHRDASARAMELLTSLGVGDRANYEVSMLSGGQQQRVAVARALAKHPSALLADEPLSVADEVRVVMSCTDSSILVVPEYLQPETLVVAAGAFKPSMCEVPKLWIEGTKVADATSACKLID